MVRPGDLRLSDEAFNQPALRWSSHPFIPNHATHVAPLSADTGGCYPGRMAIDFRRLAVATAGFSTFLHLYAPQALLPELARAFGVGAGEISAMITAGTLAIALTAPFTGAAADVLGRKRLITAAMFAATVPTVMVALAADVHTIIAWRFVQGLLLPPIFTVLLAYVGDEWPPSEIAGVAGVYVAGSSLRGILRPHDPRRAGRHRRLACRVPGAGGDRPGGRRRRRRVAAARAALRALAKDSAPRGCRCCAICATRSWSRPMRSGSGCCSFSSRCSPM